MDVLLVIIQILLKNEKLVYYYIKIIKKIIRRVKSEPTAILGTLKALHQHYAACISELSALFDVTIKEQSNASI